ncbi:MAG: glycyl radical protein [Ruminococcaceae bacterium]|nr:glycyl radical protein [Oscillospiraceae bacterium]
MKKYLTQKIKKSERIDKLVEGLFANAPEIETDRAVLLTESYKQTEGEPIITRRAKAFYHILKNIPVTIRPHELIVGSATKAPRSCQLFPEFSCEWLLGELDTIADRDADKFYVSEENKKIIRETYKYWIGKTTSDLASEFMSSEAKLAIEHNIFTPGNYFYNGIGHVTVNYGKVLKIGYKGIMEEAAAELARCDVGDANYVTKSHFLRAVILSCEAAILYAKRYSALAREMAAKESNPVRKAELEQIAKNCDRVPENGAQSFYEACQSFWFVQMLIQTESSGHSISPGRFDMYMYPYYEKDIKSGKLTIEQAQEYIDCLWVKLNDLSKARDAASAEGFAGYSMFQNLICGGQDSSGVDSTNDLSFMCIEASMHVFLPQPSLSIRVHSRTPQELMLKAAELTRTGIGLPAYYNDEVIIPQLISRGLKAEDARDYNIIGCVEPQKSGKTDGWHDAAFFNMLRPLELVFSNGMSNGEQISIKTGDVCDMQTFEEFYDAYKKQMDYMVKLMVNSDNAIDVAHSLRAPLPYLSSMIEDCIGRGKSAQEGGAIYNFTGPQGFGISNMADALYAVKKLVFDEKKFTMKQLKEALEHNFGKGAADEAVLTEKIVRELVKNGAKADEELVKRVYKEVSANTKGADSEYSKIHDMIESVNKFGNDIDEVDAFARDVAYTYTKPVEKYKNPRGGIYHAGLYPVSANVPLGKQTGATPDGRYAEMPIADGVSPAAGRDVQGPTAAANSVAKLDHFVASNGTLFNMKFHPSALAGQSGLESFVALVRGYFDQKGSHVQFNVVSRETLLDAQKHPEKYKSLVVRVAGYSALFTTLSRSLQDDIIRRTEQKKF